MSLLPFWDVRSQLRPVGWVPVGHRGFSPEDLNPLQRTMRVRRGLSTHLRERLSRLPLSTASPQTRRTRRPRGPAESNHANAPSPRPHTHPQRWVASPAFRVAAEPVRPRRRGGGTRSGRAVLPQSDGQVGRLRAFGRGTAGSPGSGGTCDQRHKRESASGSRSARPGSGAVRCPRAGVSIVTSALFGPADPGIQPSREAFQYIDGVIQGPGNGRVGGSK